MLKLKDVYELPSTQVPLTDYVITEKWIPEVATYSEDFEHSMLVLVEKEGLLQVKQLVYKQAEGDRFAALYTIWYLNLPVALVQTAGRGGRDHFNRWITNPDLFRSMCQYLRSKMQKAEDLDDVHDPEMLVYPEEVFHFYGNYFGDELGYPAEEKTKGFRLMTGSWRIIPGSVPEYVLVTAEAKFEPMPEFIRRNECVFQKVGRVSDGELAPNPRVAEVSNENGHSQIYWYKPVSRPDNVKILSV